jgi:hypothetical protein
MNLAYFNLIIKYNVLGTKENLLMASANLTNMSNFTILRFGDVPKSKFDIYAAATLLLLIT